jgi:ribonuclease HI
MRGLNLLQEKLTIYTDGSCINHGKDNAHCGSGIWINDGHPNNKAIKIPGRKQSNQIAEVAAILIALQQTAPYIPITFIADSRYAIEGLTKHLPDWENRGWINVENSKYLRATVYQLRRRSAQTSFIWVKGHTGHNGNEQADVETHVSMSVHYRILPLSKHHSALIHRTSLVRPHASIFIFHRFSARASCLVLMPISCPSHVRWCLLVRFSCYFLLSDISLSSYTRHCTARSTENPYYMYAYLYLAYSARNFGPARLVTLAVLHIFWTSCRCSGSLSPPSYSLCVVDSLALRIYFLLTLACHAALSKSLPSATGVIYLSIKAFYVSRTSCTFSIPLLSAHRIFHTHTRTYFTHVCFPHSALHRTSHDCHSPSY